MYLSVRVERVSDLPDGQLAMIELRPDGVIVYYLHQAHFTTAGAEALQALLNIARETYHQAWDLPMAPLAALAH